MTPSIIAPFSLLILLLIMLLRLLWQRRSKVDVRRLPPGSMGWPYIGRRDLEAFHQVSQHLLCQIERYGDLFKTHILGCQCVMVCGPEAARQVLVSQAHMFKTTYSPSKERKLDSIFFLPDAYPSHLRKLVQSS